MTILATSIFKPIIINIIALQYYKLALVISHNQNVIGKEKSMLFVLVP